MLNESFSWFERRLKIINIELILAKLVNSQTTSKRSLTTEFHLITPRFNFQDNLSPNFFLLEHLLYFNISANIQLKTKKKKTHASISQNQCKKLSEDQCHARCGETLSSPKSNLFFFFQLSLSLSHSLSNLHGQAPT